ncbi:MAG: ABC transporter permease subunit [Capsulimonadaceae bacterium]
MPLIPIVGRRNAKTQFVIALLYTVLALGAVTCVYPFLVMMGEAATSQYDQAEFPVIPSYLVSDRSLFAKFADDKYADDIAIIDGQYGTDCARVQDLSPPRGQALTSPDRVADWNAFFSGLPALFKRPGFGGIPGIAYSPNPLADRYQSYVERKFHWDINALNKAYMEEDAGFYTVLPPVQYAQSNKQNWLPIHDPKTVDYEAFLQTLPGWFWSPIRCDALYQTWLMQNVYPGGIADLNLAWGTHYAYFQQIPLSGRPPSSALPAQARDWESFVRTTLPIRFLVVDRSATASFDSFLHGRYHTIDAYNRAYRAHAASFASIALPDVEAMVPNQLGVIDWVDFIKSGAPLGALTVDSLEIRYRAYAQARYHLTDEQAAVCEPPIYTSEFDYVKAHAWQLRSYYAFRNYGVVGTYMSLHGRAVTVTAIYCLLSVLAALIVNPLCAYALSRFNLSYAPALLIFLLATMAFPTEVTQIPNFLQLKEFGLLNTFYALMLPTLASGYSIFLFKGFFDSLPKELYEAAMLDGAGEIRMFWSITLPLSKPIFAVIGLGAFTAAYAAFLFAILICQDAKMWTLMVWIYEMQAAGAPIYVMLAAITLASIPPLLVFIFAQNTIMKGIIIPSYK